VSDNLFWTLLTTFALVSVLSIGGANAVAPEIERVVVQQHGWLDAETFARLFGIAQAAPGPNLLLVSLIGWQVAGLTGLAVATLAVIIPSSLIALFVGRAAKHWEGSDWFKASQKALVPIALGLISASGIIMAQIACTQLLFWIIAAAATLLTFHGRYSPLWAVFGGASAALGGAVIGLV
jgi:chromate transporter